MTEMIFEDATKCFACGPDNPIGLKISFNLDDENHCFGYFEANNNHVGYEDTVHGGIIFTALDDVMANVLYLNKIKALTAKCEIRYRNPLHVGQKIKLTGWIVSQKKRLITLKADARLNCDNKIIAECDAKFMLV
ncbi:MAG: acyl-coenzyme A thioesterase PaaI-like protein [Woeseiaceae bacterium]|jgi:acyl-coenzyme A thioesterase PaaI-like protein